MTPRTPRTPLTSWRDRRDAARLDAAVEALLRGEHDVASDPLTTTATTLLQAREDLEREVAPDAEFSSSLRIRLLAEAERLADPRQVTSARPAESPSGLALKRPAVRRPRLVAGLVAGAVMAGTGVTAAAAASTALPGEALYPVKLGLERLAVVGDSPAEEGRERLEQASTRLDEAATLIRRGDPGDDALAVEALSDFSARATEGGSTLLAADLDGERDAAEQVRTFAQSSSARLDGLTATADSDLFTALVTAANTVYALDTQVDALCPECAGRAAPLASFARAADEAGRVLDGLSGVVVTAEEGTRDAAERVARETPQRQRDRSAAGRDDRAGRGDTASPSRAPQPAPTSPSPLAPVPSAPSVQLPRLPKVPTSDVPVVGSTLDQVQDVVEDQVVREVEEQVGTVTDDLLGRTGTLLP